MRPLAAKPKGGGAPCLVCWVGVPRAIISESFIDLTHPVRPLGDIVKISKWAPMKNARSRYRRISFLYMCAHPAKVLTTESEEKLLHSIQRTSAHAKFHQSWTKNVRMLAETFRAVLAAYHLKFQLKLTRLSSVHLISVKAVTLTQSRMSTAIYAATETDQPCVLSHRAECQLL